MGQLQILLTGSNRPSACKNAHGSLNWNIDVRWLSDRPVEATNCISRDLEHVSAVLQPFGLIEPAFSRSRMRTMEFVAATST
jgi:hypothetical protein